jgi:DNA-directed RNA polymerase specialized sigma24 family protein
MSSADYRVNLLRCYGYLSDYIEQADFNIYNKALATHNFGNSGNTDTYSQVASILKLINQKNQLTEIKNIITESLNELTEEERKIIAYRYIKKYSLKRVMQKLSLTKGAYYVRIKKAIDCFGAVLNAKGFDLNWYESAYAEKLWFKKLIKGANGFCDEI